MDTLLQAVTALAAARTLEDVTGVVRRHARALLRCDGVTFVLREDSQCYYADEDAIAPLWKGHRFPISACISGWVMQHRQSAVIPDIYADARVPHEAYRPTFVKSLAMVPVRTDNPIAAIGAYWAAPHQPSAQSLEILQALANAASLALHNIQLYNELNLSLERERGERQRVENANKLKDEFLATLSHELRTPLHVIQSWVWQLRHSSLPEPLHKAVEVIDRNTALQSRLIEDLLDISRASAGTLQIQRQLVDLGAVCSAVTEVVQATARAKGVRLELQRERSPYIWGDPDRMQQIIWNVLTNAVKFTPPDGHVALKVLRGPRHACIVVEDQGIGIAPEFLPYIFDRFRQADPSPTRRFGGLGLGLNIVKELVQLQGGSVRAESAGLNRGTTITIEFPVPVVLDQPGAWLRRRAGIELPATRLDGISVLLVDDEPECLSTVESVLQSHGAQVHKALSVDEALHALSQWRPTLLLADLAMPGQDGFELMRAVRALPAPLRETPAAALSAFLASEQGSHANDAGFQLFIEKPVRPQELIGQLARLAGRVVH